MKLRCTLFASLFAFSFVAYSAEKTDGIAQTEDVLKSVEAGKMVLADRFSKQGKMPGLTYTLAANVKIFVNGKEAKLTDLKTGSMITFSYDKDKNVVEIKQTTMSIGLPARTIGFKMIQDGKLFDLSGARPYELAKDVKVKIDGKDAKMEDLKNGDGIEITTDNDRKIVLIEMKSKKK